MNFSVSFFFLLLLLADRIRKIVITRGVGAIGPSRKPVNFKGLRRVVYIHVVIIITTTIMIMPKFVAAHTRSAAPEGHSSPARRSQYIFYTTISP